ncbi:MAG: hypothetical protein CBC48_07810 [bacterium TMED88]|nr:hypothetical protein [Deltaproteobacteria bacterium]OUV32773.1 MAG: hypothetical protein CBC48_07810 [bacterium TMED88]
MDRKPLIFFALSVVSALVFTTLQGCDLQDLITLDVPQDVRAAVDEPERVSLSDSAIIWERWQEYVEKNTDRLAVQIQDAERRYTTIRALFDTSLEALGDHASTLPGGLLITSALSGLGGLFLNKPGAKRKMYKANVAAFSEGVKQERAAHESST